MEHDKQEIEVTPEMIWAGVAVLDFYRGSFDDYLLVQAVYIAMVAETTCARQQDSPQLG